MGAVRPSIALLALAVVPLLAGCSDDGVEPQPDAAVHDVYIHGNAFDPAATAATSLAMPAGDTLRFENHDAHAHTATILGGLDSGDIAGNGGEHRFHDMPAGTYTFACRHHPGMRVTVTVTA